MPAALAAFETLLGKQSNLYRAHLEWIEDYEHGGEVVRTGMIECRSKGITSASVFADAIARYRYEIRGA